MDWLVVYGGGEVIYLSANYEYEASTKSKSVEKKKKADDELWIYGPFAGIQLNTTGSHWRIVFALEGNFINLPNATGWNKREERHWRPSVAASAKVLFPF